jgi:hypothetical protein
MPMLLQMCVVAPCVGMLMQICMAPIQICMAPCQLPLQMALQTMALLCPGAITAVLQQAPEMGATLILQLCGLTPLLGTCGGFFTVLSIGLSFAFLPLGLLLTMVALVEPTALAPLSSTLSSTLENLCTTLPGLGEQVAGIVGSLGLADAVAGGAETLAESMTESM